MARAGWLILFSLLFVPCLLAPCDALARDIVQCTSQRNPVCTIAQAKAECQGYNPLPYDNFVKILSRTCQVDQNGSDYGRVTLIGTFERHNGTTTVHYNQTFEWRQDCKKEPSYTGTGPWSTEGAARSGSLGCRNSCDGFWGKNADSTYTWETTGGICPNDEKKNCEGLGSGYYWNPILRVCEPPDSKCKAGTKPNSLGQCAPEPCPDGMAQQQDGTCKKMENECPAGQVRSPDGRCLPGDGQCAKGEVRGPDGTCKKDSDDDGKPDEPGEKDTFSGGDDCSVPPSCSGSPILCGQARIQWRIDCNTRKNRNIAGGSCAAMPVCTGEKCDAMEYAGLLMQWRTACAAEKLASQGNNNGGDGAQPEWTKVGGMSTDPGLGSSPDDTKVLTVKKLGVEQLDQSGFGGGGSCIGFAVSGGSGIGSGFAQAMASPPDFFCNYIILIRAVIILSAAVTCAFILTSGGKN